MPTWLHRIVVLFLALCLAPVTALASSWRFKDDGIAFDRQALTLPNCSALYAKLFDPAAFTLIVEEATSTRHIVYMRSEDGSKPETVSLDLEDTFASTWKEACRLLSTLDPTFTCEFWKRATIRRNLRSLGKFEPTSDQPIQIDIMALGHPLLAAAVALHERVHELLYPILEQETFESPNHKKAPGDILALFFELEFLQSHSSPEDRKAMLKILSCSQNAGICG